MSYVGELGEMIGEAFFGPGYILHLHLHNEADAPFVCRPHSQDGHFEGLQAGCLIGVENLDSLDCFIGEAGKTH